MFASAGLRDLFLAYPLWAEGPKAARLRALHESADVSVGVDSVGGAERLGAAVAGGRQPLRVLVEVDSGGHRTGRRRRRARRSQVAIAATARPACGWTGVFTHGGHGYRPAGAGAAALDEVASLEAAAAALEAAGFEVRTVSAGSTPTRTLAAEGRVTEIRAGTYVLGDRQQVALGAIDGDGVAAVVAATVVSAIAGPRGARRRRQGADQGPAGVRRGLRGDPRLAGRDHRARVRLPRGGVAGRSARPAPARGPSSRSSRTTSARWSTSCPRSPRCRPDGRVEHWAVDARGRSG